MAMPTRGSSKRPAPPKEPPITLKDALDDDEPTATPAHEPEPAEVEAVSAALEPVEIALTAAETAVDIAGSMLEAMREPVVQAPPSPVAIIAAKVEGSAPQPDSISLDPSVWPLKALDVVSENAAAVLDLALALGQAKSVGEAVEAQSRFASERYSNFMKRASEFVELSSRWSPFRFAVSAFVA